MLVVPLQGTLYYYKAEGLMSYTFVLTRRRNHHQKPNASSISAHTVRKFDSTFLL